MLRIVASSAYIIDKNYTLGSEPVTEKSPTDGLPPSTAGPEISTTNKPASIQNITAIR